MKTHAKELMTQALEVLPTLHVRELAQQLHQQKADGACVVENGELLGVVTTMDLIFQEKQLHLPTYITIMDAIFPLDYKRTEKEIVKITGTQVREIMTTPAVTIGPETPLDQIATMMIEKHLTLLPVTENGKLLGVVNKQSILQQLFLNKATS